MDGRRGASATGDDPSTTGLLLDPGWFSECILTLDGLLKGESAVVRRLLRSDALREEMVVVCEEDREGNAKRDDS